MPARTEPVTDTIAGVSWATIARPVSRSPQITLNTPGGRNSAAISASSTVDRRRGVARLEHDRVAGGDGRGELPDRHHHRVVPRARPGRTRRPARGGSSRSCSPCTRRRSCPRGGGRRRRRSGSGRPSAGPPPIGSAPPACRCSPPRPRSAPRRGPRPRRRSGTGRATARDGVASRQPSNAVAAASIAASMSAGPDSGAVGVLLPRHRVDHRRGRAVAGIDRLSVDEVAQCLHGTVVPDRWASRHAPARYASTMAVIATVGVPREIKTAEHRVAMTPDGVRELERHGIDVFVEAGAGAGRVDQRRRLRGRGRRHRADRRRRLGAADGGQGEGAPGRRVGVPAPRPHAVHLPPPRRLPGGRQGAGRGRRRPRSPTRPSSSTTGRCRCWRR